MRHMLDLFSGLGGASEAMVRNPTWSVLRIDNNPLLSGVPHTVIEDIKHLNKTLVQPPIGFMEKIDVIWASPPCSDFSSGFNSPKSEHVRKHGIESYEPNMDLLFEAMDIIEKVQPKYWVIENVVGSIRYFREHLGEPRMIVGPYVLWGNFPTFHVDKDKLICKKDKDVHSRNPLRSNYKAKVDFEISKGLKEAIENQKSILDFLNH